MFFRKKIPFLKQHLIDNAEDIINNSKIPNSVFFTKLLLVALNKPLFGKKRKEIRKLDNDISVFEFLCYIYSKVFSHIEKNYQEYLIPSEDQIVMREYLGEKITRKFDFFTLNCGIIKHFHNKYTDWENVDNMVENRIEFYMKKSENIFDFKYSKDILKSVVYSSPERKSPYINIEDSYDILKSSIDENLYFTVSLNSFEKSMMPLIYKEIKTVFENSPEIGFRMKNSEK